MTSAEYENVCKVDDCDAPVYIKQAFLTRDGTLVAVGLCEQHYGLESLNR